MSKDISVEKIINRLKSNSTTYGGEFGEVNNIPQIKDMKKRFYRDCDNENCSGQKVIFEYYIDILNGECRYSNDVDYVIVDDFLEPQFTLSGYYCPICERSNIKIEDRLIDENEGMNITR